MGWFLQEIAHLWEGNSDSDHSETAPKLIASSKVPFKLPWCHSETALFLHNPVWNMKYPEADKSLIYEKKFNIKKLKKKKKKKKKT